MKTTKVSASTKTLLIIVVAILTCLSVIAAVTMYQVSNRQGLVTILGQTIYLDENGNTVHGLLEADGELYYFAEENGFMVKGLQTVEDKTYFFDDSGKAAVGLQSDENGTYFFDSDKTMMTDALILYRQGTRDRISYFGSDGKMATGQVTIKEQTYTFDDTGNLLTGIDSLKQKVNDEIARHDGEIHVYFKDLRSNESFTIDDTTMYPCCMIKTVALCAVYQAIEDGTLNYDEWRQSIEDMMILSDNTSYNNLMIEVGNGDGVAGVAKATQIASDLGMEHTELNHGLKPGDNYFTNGSSNVSSPTDIGILFENLYDGNVISPQSDAAMLELMKNCGDYTVLKAGMPWAVPFAHKTGCVDRIYHDGGVAYVPGRDYVIVVFSDNVTGVRDMMARLSYVVYSHQVNSVPEDILIDKR